MSNEDTALAMETGLALLSWIATWGKSMSGESKQVYVTASDDSTLLGAADLLAEYGVFEEPHRYDFYFKSMTPKKPPPEKLEEILYAFFRLGSFYGYGVKFKEQGFQTDRALEPLFENLMSLDFVKNDDVYYYWTEKTFSLNIDGWGLFVPSLEDYRQEHKDLIFSNKEAVRLLGKIKFPRDVWKDDTLLEQAIYDRIDRRWRQNQIVWPGRLEFSADGLV